MRETTASFLGDCQTMLKCLSTDSIGGEEGLLQVEGSGLRV